jgi:hypothetical protein
VSAPHRSLVHEAIVAAAPVIAGEILCALRGVIRREHQAHLKRREAQAAAVRRAPVKK